MKPWIISSFSNKTSDENHTKSLEPPDFTPTVDRDMLPLVFSRKLNSELLSFDTFFDIIYNFCSSEP